MGVTVNSLLLGAICVAYHRIIPQKQRPSHLKIIIPMAYWNKKNVRDFQPKNNFMSSTAVFPVSDSLEEASRYANGVMMERKDPTLMAFYAMILRFIVMALPLKVFHKVFEDTVNKMTCTASNMIASLNAPWTFGGKKVDWICQSGNPYNIVSIAMSTLGDTVKVSVMVDTGVFA